MHLEGNMTPIHNSCRNRAHNSTNNPARESTVDQLCAGVAHLAKMRDEAGRRLVSFINERDTLWAKDKAYAADYGAGRLARPSFDACHETTRTEIAAAEVKIASARENLADLAARCDRTAAYRDALIKYQTAKDGHIAGIQRVAELAEQLQSATTALNNARIAHREDAPTNAPTDARPRYCDILTCASLTCDHPRT